MSKAILLKRIDDLELWTGVTETTRHFAVKVGRRRARVLGTLAEAEDYLAAVLQRMRTARSH
jgi:hypothetical protein